MDDTKIVSHSTTDPFTAVIGRYEAVHVLWEYGQHSGTCAGGGFVTKLIAAIGNADDSNRARLALGFPGYVAACNVIERHSNGIERLRKIAGVAS